jgi:hypothetical protein
MYEQSLVQVGLNEIRPRFMSFAKNGPMPAGKINKNQAERGLVYKTWKDCWKTSD